MADGGKTSGQWYFEVYVDQNTAHAIFGIASIDSSNSVAQWVSLYHSANYIEYTDGGAYSSYSLPTTALSAGNRVGVAVDFVNKTIAFAVNGFWGEELPSTSFPLTTINLTNGVWHIAMKDGSSHADAGKFTLQDASEAQYAVPLGFQYWMHCSTD